ncbi:hypothetical protein [Rhodobacter viridis]|uniref:hypothetical protein n=1 Tax=Rhodobacter viridis TaxID=1054202 RepID=UPI001C64EE98|nr:hypothetical protein [Rhodobacter viridis]
MLHRGGCHARSPDSRNPRILIVTDRDDLDNQIKDTFKSCDLKPIRATSGSHCWNSFGTRRGWSPRSSTSSMRR